MNVFTHELRGAVRATLVWAASLSLVGFAMLAFFPPFERDVAQMVEMLKNYPAAVLRALGLDPASINSFNGYYSFMLSFVTLSAAIQGLVLGISVISKEGARKTSDFLFTKPLSRAHILTAKYSAMVVMVMFTSACFIVTTYFACTAFVADLDMRAFWLFSGAFALTQLMCLSIGFCMGCCVRRIKAPNTLGVSIGALMFALMMVENLSEGNSIALISPLSYLNPRYIASHRAYQPWLLTLLLMLTVGLVVVGVARYVRRDIHSA